ncbi:MAG: hypothetical protein ACI845_004433 [Gammaproteobacteria bacterium]|jgi:hypothetical protein
MIPSIIIPLRILICMINTIGLFMRALTRRLKKSARPAIFSWQPVKKTAYRDISILALKQASFESTSQSWSRPRQKITQLFQTNPVWCIQIGKMNPTDFNFIKTGFRKKFVNRLELSSELYRMAVEILP